MDDRLQLHFTVLYFCPKSEAKISGTLMLPSCAGDITWKQSLSHRTQAATVSSSVPYARLMLYGTLWILSICNTLGFNFIDNFNLFWNRPAFYRKMVFIRANTEAVCLL